MLSHALSSQNHKIPDLSLSELLYAKAVRVIRIFTSQNFVNFCLHLLNDLVILSLQRRR